METFDVLVIGAGQAGLATGWHLQRAGYRFLLLEATERASGAWRSYYDSLELFSPAAYSGLPGLPFPGLPGHYPQRDEVVAYLEAYASHFHLPIRYRQRVQEVRRENAHFLVRTEDGTLYAARALIAASGTFGQPYTPALPGLADFKGRSLHSAEYRRPHGYEGQRVVVVGGANSGVQIACELAEVASVTLATRRPIRFFPQRLLGREFHYWLKLTRLEKTRWLSDQGTPVLDGGAYRRAIAGGRPDRQPMFRRVLPWGVEWADGREEAVDVLLFATGFRPHVPYLASLGLLQPNGQLRQRNGVSLDVPGLYFVGFPGQRNFASATLRGAGDDAAVVLQHLSRWLSPQA